MQRFTNTRTIRFDGKATIVCRMFGMDRHGEIGSAERGNMVDGSQGSGSMDVVCEPGRRLTMPGGNAWCLGRSAPRNGQANRQAMASSASSAVTGCCARSKRSRAARMLAWCSPAQLSNCETGPSSAMPSLDNAYSTLGGLVA